MTTNTLKQWDPVQYAENARFVSDLGRDVVGLLSPQASESILDLGCGDGALTLELTGRVEQVVAVDSSAEMVNAACKSGLNALVMSGENLTFMDQFDAVFSNAALHWMTSPQLVIQGVWRALKNGGRFVGEMGGARNVFTIISALETALTRRGKNVNSPWFFPTVSHYRNLLEKEGFQVTYIETIIRPTLLPDDVSGWLATFAKTYLAALPEAERPEFIDEVTEDLRPLLCDENGNWFADYVRLRFSANKIVNSQENVF